MDRKGDSRSSRLSATCNDGCELWRDGQYVLGLSLVEAKLPPTPARARVDVLMHASTPFHIHTFVAYSLPLAIVKFFLLHFDFVFM